MKPPIIIIGAPRSGTNMLRDLICDIDGFVTWPCDEINYIWRYRNSRFPTDCLRPEHATKRVKQYVRSCFATVARNHQDHTVIEKTCANCLRIPFVHSIFPDARYIMIRRDGVDAVASAVQRWRASIEWTYILKKARFVPIADMPFYAARYVSSQIYRLASGERRLASWGPRFDGMKSLLEKNDLLEACAHQWRACVSTSTSDLAAMHPDKVHYVRYEDLVRKDVETIDKLAEFMQTSPVQLTGTETYQLINDNSIGKGARSLSAPELEMLAHFVRASASEVELR